MTSIENVIEKMGRDQILDIENKMFQNFRGSLYVLISKVDGNVVDGIFTSHKNALKFLIRQKINFIIDSMKDDEELEFDRKSICENKEKINQFQSRLHDSLQDDYEIITIDHIDFRKKIYVLQNKNFKVKGNPIKYLTNELEDLKKYLKNKLLDSEIKYYTLEIDPELPGFLLESEEDENPQKI